MIRWRTRLGIAGIAATLVVSTYVQEPAAAARPQRIAKLEAWVRDLHAEVVDLRRAIRTQEQVTAEQGVQLGWFVQCIRPLDVSAFVGFTDVPIGEHTWVVEVRNGECTASSLSGFPW